MYKERSTNNILIQIGHHFHMSHCVMLFIVEEEAFLNSFMFFFKNFPPSSSFIHSFIQTWAVNRIS